MNSGGVFLASFSVLTGLSNGSRKYSKLHTKTLVEVINIGDHNTQILT